VLGNGQGNASYVRFLESVAADEVNGNLAGDADDGGRVHHGRRNTRNQVGGSRAGGRHRHADFTGGAGVAIGHVGCALLVADENVVNGIVEHGVVNRHNSPAGIAKDNLNPFPHQTFPKDFRTCFDHIAS
jgi:hypothetical protein